jgi:hypothetical protein
MEYTTPFVAGPGGVMTDDVGVITGELELRTTLEPGGVLLVRVRYAGAKEWYRVRAAEAKLHDERDHRALHTSLLGILHRPTG